MSVAMKKVARPRRASEDRAAGRDFNRGGSASVRHQRPLAVLVAQHAGILRQRGPAATIAPRCGFRRFWSRPWTGSAGPIWRLGMIRAARRARTRTSLAIP
jgi:hypothetical protein